MLAGTPTERMPLCVDLNGGLIRSDLLLESMLLMIKHNPFYLMSMLRWVLRGKAVLEAEVFDRVELNAAALPYDRELVDWLRSERLAGRSLWLCTAADQKFAESVATHLGVFEGVIASGHRIDQTGETQAAVLLKRFGERGFDYCGDGQRSVAIWRHAHGAIVSGGGGGGGAIFDGGVAGITPLLRVFPARKNTLRALARAMRPHQWVKNALIFVPMIAAHIARDPRAITAGILAVVAFCLCASSVYLLNDLLDLEADRAHPRKSKRPFASGDLSILQGLVIAPILLGSAAIIAALLPTRFQLGIGIYYVLTVAYSFALKKRVLVDALALAALYTLRIIAGAAAVGVPLSFWLLLFSIFLFLSLALVKRYAELDALRRQQRLRTEGRGYHVEDLPLMLSLGTASGYLSVLVLGLYINSTAIAELYRRPKIVWMLCVLMLFWVSRVWMITHRGTMHDDPVVFALKDPTSLIVGLLAVITLVAAT